jgi:hypothetical protein
MAKQQPNDISVFSPLDKRNLGESVAEALLNQPVFTLPPATPFGGAGIYALYYEGDFPLYREITTQNRDGLYRWPIYVGKAVPAGARKGGYGLNADLGQSLFKRLKEHSASITAVKNLNLSDFRYRSLVVDDIWIPLAESLLVEAYSPLWNQAIDGFGNHDPGRGGRRQQRSPWDVLHPGRPWADELQASSLDKQAIHKLVFDHLARTKNKITNQKKMDAR